MNAVGRFLNVTQNLRGMEFPVDIRELGNPGTFSGTFASSRAPPFNAPRNSGTFRRSPCSHSFQRARELGNFPRTPFNVPGNSGTRELSRDSSSLVALLSTRPGTRELSQDNSSLFALRSTRQPGNSGTPLTSGNIPAGNFCGNTCEAFELSHFAM